MNAQFHGNHAQYAPHGPGAGMHGPRGPHHHRHRGHGHRHGHHHGHGPRPVHHHHGHGHHHGHLPQGGLAPPPHPSPFAPHPIHDMLHGGPPDLGVGPAPPRGGLSEMTPNERRKAAFRGLKIQELEVKLNLVRSRMALVAARRRRAMRQPCAKAGHKKLGHHDRQRPAKAERLEQRLAKLEHRASKLVRSIAERHGALMAQHAPHGHGHGHGRGHHPRHHHHRHHHHHHRAHGGQPRSPRKDLFTVNELPAEGPFTALVDVRGIAKMNRARGEQVKVSAMLQLLEKQAAQVRLFVPVHLAKDLGIGDLEKELTDKVRIVVRGGRVAHVLANEAKTLMEQAPGTKVLVVTCHPKIRHVLSKTLGAESANVAFMRLGRFHDLVQGKSPTNQDATGDEGEQAQEPQIQDNANKAMEDGSSSSSSSSSEESDSDSDDNDDDDEDDFEAIDDDDDVDNIELDHAFAMALALGYNEAGCVDVNKNEQLVVE